MSSKKKDLKQKAKPKQVAETPKQELTEDHYDQIQEAIEEFQTSYLTYLAGSENFDVVPTTLEESGRPLGKKHYELIKREARRLSLVILYSFEVGNHTAVVNPKTARVCLLSNGEVH